MIKATRKPVKKKMIKRKPLMLNSKLKLPSKRGNEVPEALIRRPRIKIIFTTTRTTASQAQNRISHDNSSILEHEATLMTHGTAGSPFPRKGKESVRYNNIKTEEMNASFYSSKGSAGSPSIKKPPIQPSHLPLNQHRRSMHAISKEIIQPKRATFPELLQQIEV